MQPRASPNPLLPHILKARTGTTETLPHPPGASSILHHTPDSTCQSPLPWKAPPKVTTGLQLPTCHCHSIPETGEPGVPPLPDCRGSCGPLPSLCPLPRVVGPQDSKDKVSLLGPHLEIKGLTTGKGVKTKTTCPALSRREKWLFQKLTGLPLLLLNVDEGQYHVMLKSF